MVDVHEFIPFDIAQKIYLNYNGNSDYVYSSFGGKPFQLYPHCIYTEEVKYPAPTLEEMRTWLRKEHDVDINLIRTSTYYHATIIHNGNIYQVERFKPDPDNFCSESFMYDFETYEECLEKSIRLVISLIF